MKPTRQPPVPVRKLCRKAVLFGTAKGKEDFAAISERLANRAGVIALDMRGLDVVDTAWTREVVGRLLREAGENRAYYLDNVADGVQDNISDSLHVGGLAILARRPSGHWRVIGKPISRQLDELLQTLKELRQATPRELADRLGDLSLTACNNRLRDLRELGLVMRVEAPPDGGGRQYSYSFLW